MKLLAPPLVALLAVAGSSACDMTHVRKAGQAGKEEQASDSVPRATAAPVRGSATPPSSASAAPAPPSVAPPPSSLGSSAATINRGPDEGCDGPGVRQAIAQQLFRDDEFLGYICEESCTTQEFLEGLTFREVTLRDEPRTLGCIVGPLHEAMTRIYGVFVLSDQPPRLALIYTGIDISVDPEFKKPGFKDLVGSERLDPGTWVTHRYAWHHEGYALESTTEAVER